MNQVAGKPIKMKAKKQMNAYFRVVLLLQSCFATYSEHGYPTFRRALKPLQDKEDRYCIGKNKRSRAPHAADTAKQGKERLMK